MEQKRTLWIVSAVGVFLLVVLGAALILYTPAARPVQSIASTKKNTNTASNGWISLAPPSQNSVQETNTAESADQTEELDSENSIQNKGAEFKADEVNIYAEKANVYSENTELSALGNNASVTVVTNNEKANKETTIDLTPAAKSVSNTKAETKPAVKAVAVKPAATATAKAPAKAASKPTPKVTAKPAAKAEPEIIQYWIQVTALTSRKSADEARSKLDENQITADVFTYTNNKNQLFYRVRVGPYTTKSEAEYWRTKIAKIDTFKDTASYVTSTTVAN